MYRSMTAYPPDLEPFSDDDATCGRAAAPDGARLHHARLVMHDGDRFNALTPEGAVWVTRAAGCLLQPEVGDVALVSLVAGQGYVLTVLERGAPDSAARVTVPGDLALSLPAGRLDIDASGGVMVQAGPAFSLTSEQACLVFTEADVACHRLHSHGVEAHTNWTRRTDVCSEHLEIATRAEAHLGESYRRIAGHEDVTLGSQRTQVVEDWSVRSRSAELKAQDRVAVDAASVQIG